MSHDLISEQDYENLPEEPDEQFLALEKICRQNMLELITNETPNTYDEMVRLSYMSTVSAAAEELGFDSLFPYYKLVNKIEGFSEFLLSANGLATRLRLRKAGRNPSTSVRLTNRTRGLIELQINKLREIISTSDLPREKQAALLKKLDELIYELSNTRISFSRVMAILAYVGMGVGGATGFLADAPEALTTITSLIGQDKEAENEEVRRLGPPPETKTASTT